MFKKTIVLFLSLMIPLFLIGCKEKESTYTFNFENGTTSVWVNAGLSRYYEITLPSGDVCYIIPSSYETEDGTMYTAKDLSSDKKGYIEFYVLSATLDFSKLSAKLDDRSFDKNVVLNEDEYYHVRLEGTNDLYYLPTAIFKLSDVKFGKNYVVNITGLIS
ncbi:hypothetical protein LJC17_03155 [Acholeplasma sp. OttesenSCG-928-E16]|nr:hypothetical protein [Acholeplasma sp. OttesenSCG-928-E16]